MNLQSELPRPMYLTYGGEKVDDDPQWTVSFAKSMRHYVLGAVEHLLDEWAWEGDPATVRAAQIAVSELLARIATGGTMADQGLGGVPLFVPAVVCYWYAGRNPQYLYQVEDRFIHSAVYVDGTNENAPCTWLRASLLADTYKFGIVHDEGPNRGKYGVQCTPVGLDVGPIDCYSAGWVSCVVDEYEFVVDNDGTYSFSVNKHLKNPASSACHLSVNAFYIREKHYEEG